MKRAVPWNTKMNQEEDFVSIGEPFSMHVWKATQITRTIFCNMSNMLLMTSAALLIRRGSTNSLLWRKIRFLVLTEFHMVRTGVLGVSVLAIPLQCVWSSFGRRCSSWSLCRKFFLTQRLLASMTIEGKFDLLTHLARWRCAIVFSNLLLLPSVNDFSGTSSVHLSQRCISSRCKHCTSKFRKLVKKILHENNGYGIHENKCATNYSIIINHNWNDAYNKQLTKYDTNDDVDTVHLHLNGRVAYMHWVCTHCVLVLQFWLSHASHSLAQVLSAFIVIHGHVHWRTSLIRFSTFVLFLFLLSVSVFLFHLELFLELHYTKGMANLRCSAAEEGEDALNVFIPPTQRPSGLLKLNSFIRHSEGFGGIGNVLLSTFS